MIRSNLPVLTTKRPSTVAQACRPPLQPAVIRPRGAVLLKSIVGRTLPKKEGS